MIDDKQFEDLCCDLLDSLNQFENVMKMGGAPGDLKRDITATERIETAFGIEHRKWIVQCKHYLKSKVTPNDLPSLTNAISTHNADGLLVITSGELTPNARIYLEKFSNDSKNPYKAMWIEKHKLEDLLENNPELKNKYWD
ncbi:Restriction endonuclease [Thermoplasmatales archaeon SCGC AB-540-F20]|nr:Restriction endonuclease [Thermoplasmatales archaeon SCGC AB-540-F20]